MNFIWSVRKPQNTRSSERVAKKEIIAEACPTMNLNSAIDHGLRHSRRRNLDHCDLFSRSFRSL
jgi:hypothetical protein